jgi:hypothetical protein
MVFAGKPVDWNMVIDEEIGNVHSAKPCANKPAVKLCILI